MKMRQHVRKVSRVYFISLDAIGATAAGQYAMNKPAASATIGR